jgi:hypothetical protein
LDQDYEAQNAAILPENREFAATIYRITDGFLYAATSNFEEGYWKRFYN